MKQKYIFLSVYGLSQASLLQASNDLTPLLINLGLVQATLGSHQGHQLVNHLVVAVGGMGCDIHQKVIILFHAFPRYNVAFGSRFGGFYKAKAGTWLPSF